MIEKTKYQDRIELLLGTLDMLVLYALQREPMHGYAIAQVIGQRSGEVRTAGTGSLYPALHRLERQKWVKSEWRLTESKQRAKFYQLTALGRKQLTAGYQRWLGLVRAIGAVMAPGAVLIRWPWEGVREGKRMPGKEKRDGINVTADGGSLRASGPDQFMREG